MASERCGARTRAGGACRSPAVSGRRRCRMHGGAKGSGAPSGNSNALKSGLYTAERQAMRLKMGVLMRAGKKLLRDI
ncbi:HGGxSTG domain-containing protein [Sphingorhabdus sp.]|uniref:HGGxSTG domain-containing protein n=1 Tax=Sphingorhabdus sp. TaxID=1902408 RepID=UPI004047B93A